MAKSTIARGASMAADVWGRLDERVQALGGTENALHILAKNESASLVDAIAQLLVIAELKTMDFFQLAVDYGKPLMQMIEEFAGGTKARGDINAEHFPMTGEGVQEYTGVLVTLDRRMSNDAVTAELEKMGLEDAHIEHLCAFAAKYQNLQWPFPIAVRGSSWVDPERGYAVYPLLPEWEDSYAMDIVDLGGGCWPCGWQLLALRKG